MASLPRAAAALAVVAALAIGSPSACASTVPIVRLAGTGSPAVYQGVNPPQLEQNALTTTFSYAGGVAATGGRAFDFADYTDGRVFAVTQGGSMHLVAGDGSGSARATTSQPAVSTSVINPTSIQPYGIGALYIAEGQTFSGGVVRTVDDFGNLNPGYTTITDPVAISTGTDGTGYVASGSQRVIDKITPPSTVTVVAGSGNSSDPAPSADDPKSGDIGNPFDVAMDPSDAAAFFFTSGTTSVGKVWRVTGAGTAGDGIAVVAGNGTATPLNDGGDATSAGLGAPTSVAPLADGGFLVYDGTNERIRRVSSGKISTIAGNGTVGLAPSGTPADVAAFENIGDLAVGSDGVIVSQSSAGVVELLPAVAIADKPPDPSGSRSATFSFASWDSGAAFECTLDKGTAGPCHTYTDLFDGLHTLDVTANTNNQTLTSSPVSYSWTVDATPPAEFGLTAPDDGGTVPPKPTFTWQEANDATSGIDHYELWIDGAKAGETSTCCSIDPVLSDGPHTWEVKAVDKVGNVRESATRSFTVSDPPTASLVIAPNPALVGRTITFDASKSTDANGSVVHYQWDLDGNGTFETDTGATPQATRSFDKPQTVAAKVRVTDDGGSTGDAAGTLVVTATPTRGKQLGVSVNDGAQFTNDPHVTVVAVWPGFASDMLISNDGLFKNAVDFPVAAETPWTLDSSGPERLPKTIYVRFLGGLQTSETYQDDIILDQTPPKVLSATLGPGAAASGARAAKARLVTLHVKAKDNVSGVGALQVTPNKRKPGRFIRYRKTLNVIAAPQIWVRARDRAGNLSRWRKASGR